MGSVTISPPNSILFVLDPTNKDVIVPSYINEELIAATETCVSVGTQASVDGEVSVSLDFGSITPSGFYQTFAGNVAAPGGKVAVVTAEFQRLLELDVPKGKVDLVIWVDDLHNPAQVTVSIKPNALN
jgi:hypothetical protein